jgi:hypothetical protein
MSLQSRLGSLIEAIGIDIKSLNDRVAIAGGESTVLLNRSTDFDLTGLDGVVDVGYEILIAGHMSSNKIILIRPNNDASAAYAGMYELLTRSAGASISGPIGGLTGGPAANGLQASNAPGSTGYNFVSRCLFHAQAQSAAYGRAFFGAWSSKSDLSSGESLKQEVTMWWNPASFATQVNKLTFHFGGAVFNGRITVKRL